TFCGEQDDGNGRGQWISTHSVKHLQPCHFWHHNIKQHQVWRQLSNQLQGALAIPGLSKVVGTQQKGNQATDVGLIIRDNQARLHRILLSFPPKISTHVTSSIAPLSKPLYGHGSGADRS